MKTFVLRSPEGEPVELNVTPEFGKQLQNLIFEEDSKLVELDVNRDFITVAVRDNELVLSYTVYNCWTGKFWTEAFTKNDLKRYLSYLEN